MPFTIDISTETRLSRACTAAPASARHGFLRSLLTALTARTATRRMLRRLRRPKVAAAHLPQYLRTDVGLPPLPSSSSHWEIRS